MIEIRVVLKHIENEDCHWHIWFSDKPASIHGDIIQPRLPATSFFEHFPMKPPFPGRLQEGPIKVEYGFVPSNGLQPTLMNLNPRWVHRVAHKIGKLEFGCILVRKYIFS